MFANSEDSEENLLVKKKTSYFRNADLWSLKIWDGLSFPYCRYLYWKIHQNAKGYKSF